MHQRSSVLAVTGIVSPQETKLSTVAVLAVSVLLHSNLGILNVFLNLVLRARKCYIKCGILLEPEYQAPKDVLKRYVVYVLVF